MDPVAEATDAEDTVSTQAPSEAAAPVDSDTTPTRRGKAMCACENDQRHHE